MRDKTKEKTKTKVKTHEKTADKKIKLIIDSDVANEVDDQFAISYALSRRDIFDVLAITIAPFRVSWQKGLSIRDGLIDSKNEAYRLLRLFGIKHTQKEPLVYLGSSGFLSEGYNEKSPAVTKIISLAKKNDEVTICAIGTLTNVAMALRIEPKIAKKIKVVWLGTDNVMLEKFDDSNYRKDKQAFNEVLASDVDLTIFPTFLARSFITSTYEFAHNCKKNDVTSYLNTLLERFIFSEENLGIKTIYDIGPVAYLLHKDKFSATTIVPNILIKEEKINIPKGRKINYITAVPKHSFVWQDFIKTVGENKDCAFKPNIFFSSDTHFGDERKIKLKQVPFSNVEEMNKELVKRWNNKVGPNDIVYHLGDFGDYEYVKQLNGKIILICGNHELYDMKKNFELFRNKLLKLGFTDVIKDGLYLDKEVFGQRVYLTHKPSDHAKDCLTLFGHVHDLALVKEFGFNVCVSYHYFSPISSETARRYLKFIKGWADFEVFL
ncbi:MAG: nucleoside hydrolase [Candidatus Caccovivens sp.]